MGSGCTAWVSVGTGDKMVGLGFEVWTGDDWIHGGRGCSTWLNVGKEAEMVGLEFGVWAGGDWVCGDIG